MSWLSGSCQGVDRIKIVVIATVTCSILANLYCWTNSLFSHDSLLIIQHEVAHNASIGRPFQELYVWFRGSVVAPLLVGSLGVLFLVVSNLAVVSLLSIYSRSFVIAACSLLSVNATVTLINATYISWFDIMMFSCALSSIAAWLICKTKKGFLPAILIVCLSMGLYQSYLQVCALLGLAFCARCVAVGEDRLARACCIKGLVVLTLGVCLYFVSAYFAREVVGVGGASGYNSVFAAFSWGGGGVSIFQALALTWIDPFSYLLFPETHAVRLVALANCAILFAGICCVYFMLRYGHMGFKQRAAFWLTICLMPFAAGCINFAAFGGVHSMMIYSYFILYPIVFSAIELCFSNSGNFSIPQFSRAWDLLKKIILPIILVITSLITFSNIVYANQVYLKKDLEYQATLSALTRLEEKLEEIDSYQPGKTPVLFLGSFSENPILNDVREGFPPERDQWPISSSGGFTKYAVGLGASVSLYSSHYIELYFKNILGCPIAIVNEVSIDSEIEEAVPNCFPLDGSIRKIEDMVVVRLS